MQWMIRHLGGSFLDFFLMEPPKGEGLMGSLLRFPFPLAELEGVPKGVAFCATLTGRFLGICALKKKAKEMLVM
jgi:hypothetical protein